MSSTMMSKKRKAIIDKIVSVMNIVDKSGSNSKTYIEKFKKMTDDEITLMMTEFRDNENSNLYLEMEEYVREPSYDDVIEALNFIGVPAFETVVMPDITGDPDNPVVTPEPVLVGYMHVKRLMQAIQTKNAGSIDISKRNAKTGQVTGDDRNGRNSDVETSAMLAIGAENGLREIMGFRSDDMAAKDQAYASIENNGYVSLNELKSTPEDRVAINSLDVYFTAAGFKTNLVHGGNLLISPKEKRIK